MHCKSLWIKAFAKCINVNVSLKNIDLFHDIQIFCDVPVDIYI